MSIDYWQLFNFSTHLLLTTLLGWYLITNLQWYHYKIERVVLKHHKPLWHLFYFVTPYVAYFFTKEFFWIFFYFAYMPAFYIWYRKLDKPLVLTWRVKRFLLLLISLTLFSDAICIIKFGTCEHFSLFLPLLIALIGSMAIEKYLYIIYYKEAKKKLKKMEHLTVIAITGSYGKTSTKRILAQLLARHFTVYATPRSVNTEAGIVKDINTALPEQTRVYICEAGARESGDIARIAKLVEPHVSVVLKVGEQHIEYFKTLENIKRTKLELIQSPRLQQAFVYEGVTNEPHEKVTFFGSAVTLEHATLQETAFTFNNHHFNTSILGAFSLINIEAALHVCTFLGIDVEALQQDVAALEPIEHRLQKIEAGGKLILDDSYNGNLDGMLEGIRLCSLHKQGKRLMVTPGLVESSEALNSELITAINEVFDTVIVTGGLNRTLFKQKLQVEEAIFLEDKHLLEATLAKHSNAGDIIYFANDAPNFI